MSILNARRPPLASPLRPTWAWDFARYGRVPPGTTYTGSGGTFVGSNGLIQSATTNVPRFYWDPTTLSPWGYLAEMASTNLLLRSAAFDNAAWIAVNGGTGSAPVVTANDAVAPDGTTTADKVVFNAGAGTSSTDQSRLANTVTGLTNGGSHGCSIYVKGTAGTQLVFDPLTGGGSVFLVTCTGGWDRVRQLGTAAGTSSDFLIGIRQGTSVGTINSTATVWLWGAQVDSVGVGVTSYIPTAGSTVTRAQDVLSLPLTSLPGWSATQGGVLVAAYRLHTLVPSSPGYNQTPLYLRAADVNNSLLSYGQQGGGGKRRVIMFSGGSEYDGSNSIASPTVFTRTNQAAGWSATRLQQANDGTNFVSATIAGALPVSPTTLVIGAYDSGSHGLQGTLESIAYYRGARSDAFVQAVSR